MAAILAPVGVVIGKWVGASKGLGYLMMHANARLQTPLSFAALGLLMLLALSFAQAAEKVLLRLDWFVNPNHAAILAAQQSRAFARQGLTVETIAPADSASVPLLLAAGKADLAVGYQPQLYTLVDKGVPVIRVVD
ncbi:ABC transporter substrate-binding protein [Candidatus Pantoea persica]|uniref:ABC transporter substrate-binding protein n=1 Tax=Candidatus Pantoea persica TaxID=2518128 RepID=UPI00286811EE|nr:ABC transporter substrate-binding protein [Candidatus Pantoea persica]MBA2814028.1 putative thiamine biosynthesis protein [Candidatus Pantoea persica]